MKTKIEAGGLDCLCSIGADPRKIAYVLYPMEVLDDWIESAATRYDTTIVVVTGMDWDNVFSPWPAPGEPPGSPDFKGESAQFLKLLQTQVVPLVESRLGVPRDARRSLVGVSMSGLFALWQWMVCDTFTDIASLSGSFWFPGFPEWMKSRPAVSKTGKAYFLLGNQEARSPVKAFQCVAANTAQIVDLLRSEGVDVEFESVAGNHFADPLPRLDRAFAGLYKTNKDDGRGED